MSAEYKVICNSCGRPSADWPGVPLRSLVSARFGPMVIKQFYVIGPLRTNA